MVHPSKFTDYQILVKKHFEVTKYFNKQRAIKVQKIHFLFSNAYVFLTEDIRATIQATGEMWVGR